MKIEFTKKELTSFDYDLMPSVKSFVEEFTDGDIKVPETSLEKIFKGNEKTKGYEVKIDKRTGNFEMTINDEAMCDIIKVVSKLYSKFKPVITLIKSAVEFIENIMEDYTTDIDNINQKWFLNEETNEESSTAKTDKE